MPVRDGVDHLYEAMASLVAQTFEDFEVVAVDDGSTDGTGEMLEDWGRRDDRVTVLRTGASGIVNALERARAASRGRYVARMDADDVADPRRLEAQIALLESDPTLAACGCGVRYFPRAVVRDGARRYETWLNSIRTPEEVARAIWVECPLAHPTFCLRMDALTRVGGYRDPGWPEDYDLVLRMHRAGYRMANVPEVLHGWREGPGRLSRTHPRYSAEAFLRCRVHHLCRGPLPEGRAAVVWGAGPVGKALARALIDTGRSVDAFVELDPRKIGQEIHGARVVTTADALEIAGPLHLAAVGQNGARARIAALLEEAGFRPGRDFVAVA